MLSGERRKSCAFRLHLQGQYPGRNSFLLLRFRCMRALTCRRVPRPSRRLACFRPQLRALRQGDERCAQRNLTPSRHQHVHRPEPRHELVPGRKKVNHKGPVVHRVSFLSRLDLVHHQPDRTALGKNLRVPPINTARQLPFQRGSRRSFLELRAPLHGNPNHRSLTVGALRIRGRNRRPGDKRHAHNFHHEGSSQGTISSIGGLTSGMISPIRVPQDVSAIDKIKVAGVTEVPSRCEGAAGWRPSSGSRSPRQPSW